MAGIAIFRLLNLEVQMNAQMIPSMNYELVFRDEYCEIFTLTSIPCIYQRYYQLPEGKEYLRSTLQLILDIAKNEQEQGRHTHYLIEVYQGKMLPSDDVTWIQKDFIAQLWESGIRHVAYVSSHNVFSQFVMENILENKFPEKVTIRVFQDLDNALQWLHHLPVS